MMNSKQSVFLSRTHLALATFVAVVAFSVHNSVRAAETDRVYQVNAVKFKPGKAPEALKIVHEHFHKVDRTIGRHTIPFDYQTGEWDHVVYFPYDLARGDTIPSFAEWMKALAAQEGGMDQAQKLMQSFLDLVDTSRNEIARLPAAWVP
jgi:hypothetical protein